MAIPKPDPTDHHRDRRGVREAARRHRQRRARRGLAAAGRARAVAPARRIAADAARGAAPARRVEPRRAAPRLGRRRAARIATGRSRCSPAYLRYGKPEAGQPTIGADPDRHARDAPRGRARGDPADRAARSPRAAPRGARAAMARAWSMRDTPAYAREDFEVMRADRRGRAVHARAVAAQPDREAVARRRERAAVRGAPARRLRRGRTRKFFDLIEAGEADEACALMTRLPRASRRAASSKALQVLAMTPYRTPRPRAGPALARAGDLPARGARRSPTRSSITWR